MKNKIFTILLLVLAVVPYSEARDVYGSIKAGYGTLLEPDISGPGVRKGGFTAVLQEFLGEENIKYGAEFGMIEVYTSWDKNRLNTEGSLILLPLHGALMYDIAPGAAAPYVGISAGPCFAIEHYSHGVTGSGDSSSSSTVYGGGSLTAGLKVKASPKYNIDVSCRYILVNASERVTMAGVYAGIGMNMTFFKTGKAEAMRLPMKERQKENPGK
jgi:hypothetical protein